MKTFVRSGTAELCVEEAGAPAAAGAPLVFLHAGVTDRRLWAPQREALGASYRVVAYDRRGFGESRLPPAGSREAFSQVDDLFRVLDALRLDSAVLIGCSQGGRIAIDAALAYPQRVRALVLVAAAVTGAPEIDLPYSALTQSRIEAYDAAEQRGDQAALNELEAQFWLDGPDQPTGRVGGALRELFLAMNTIPLASGSPGEEIVAASAWERLEAIRVPTLVVWGTYDFEHLRMRMRDLVRRIPGAIPFVVDSAAHLPSLEQPAIFNRELARFLGTL
jgi:pimeloyl-ACP methyl ester carboxylesterase